MWTRRVLPLLLLASWTVGSACAPDTAPAPDDRGNRGFPCHGSEDCNAPLVCARTRTSTFRVCTGTALAGEPCSSVDAPGGLPPTERICAWVEDERGAPLVCGDDGGCRFLRSEPPKPDAGADGTPDGRARGAADR